jgi:heat shock protein 5
MTQEAEKFADEDKKFRENTESRQKLESYIYQTSQALNDDSVRSKLGDDAESLDETLKEAQEWLEENAEGEAEDYSSKLKEVEESCGPALKKVAGAGGGGDGGSFDDEDDNEDL